MSPIQLIPANNPHTNSMVSVQPSQAVTDVAASAADIALSIHESTSSHKHTAFIQSACRRSVRSPNEPEVKACTHDRHLHVALVALTYNIQHKVDLCVCTAVFVCKPPANVCVDSILVSGRRTCALIAYNIFRQPARKLCALNVCDRPLMLCQTEYTCAARHIAKHKRERELASS